MARKSRRQHKGTTEKTSVAPEAPAQETRTERRQRERKQRQERGGSPDVRPLLSAEWPHRYLRVGLLLSAIAIIAAVRMLPMFSERLEERPDLRRMAADGHEYPYLIGQDSYSWVGKAQSYLDTGSACDEIVDGVCRDTKRHAPVGSEMPYGKSLHIHAIAWLHVAITAFRPTTPIEVSAFFLQVLIGALGAIPAFFIGTRLGGAFGGFAAALLVGLHEDVFQRSLNADNDVWNVVLPICAVWAMLGAIDGSVLWKRLACGLGAGLVIGLHADIWSGFGLGFLVLVVGLAGFTAWTAARLWRASERPALKRELGVLALIGCLSVGGTAALGYEYHDEWNEIASHLRLPRPFSREDATERAAKRAERKAQRGDVAKESPNLRATFPFGLKNVGELRKLERDVLVERLGGSWVLFGCCFGLLVLLLPFGSWTAAQTGVLSFGAVLLGAAVFVVKATPVAVVITTAFPAAVLLGMRLRARAPAEPAPIAGAFLLGAWLFATISLSATAQRFVILAAAPVGLALGCGAGHLIHHVRRTTRKPATSWVMVAVLVAAVAGLSQKGVVYARRALPDLNDTWWDAMTKLKEISPEDAIVHAWWPYGYWIKYIAQRAVGGDGASPLSRITHWTGRALMASNEREAVGWLRMLSCGSDANGEPEQRFGAPTKLGRAGLTSLQSYSMLERLVSMTRAEATQALSQFSPEVRDDILASTHCNPRPTYLVLSDKQARQGDLRYQGNWDPRRALIVNRLRDLPDEKAMGIMLTQLGLRGTEAVALLAKARAAQTDAQREHFIAPSWPPYYATRCRSEGEERTCRIEGRTGQRQLFDEFRYLTSTPERGVFTYKKDGVTKTMAPDTIVVLGPAGMQTYHVANSSARDHSVLIDQRSGRVIVGASSLVRSVFTRLLYFRHVQVPGFERVDDRSGGGERVLTFRVRFPRD